MAVNSHFVELFSLVKPNTCFVFSRGYWCFRF